MSRKDRIGVGIVGAGPVVQAIHVPTLARLSELFEIRVVLDVVPEIAASVAARLGARPTGSYDDLLDDPSVEVVAICSPPRLHAAQVIAAMEAGKRAVFCEKPLATTLDDARLIAEASHRTGVPLVVGAMHMFDPGWLAVLPELERLRSEAHTIRSSIVLPFNDRFEDWATEVLARPPMPDVGVLDAEGRADLMSMAVLGLAIHDLPLVRMFTRPAPVEITSAALLEPFGYGISGRVDGTVLDVVGIMNAQWRVRWEFEAVSEREALSVEFTPSFVHAGSAVAHLSSDGLTRTFGGFDHNGYEGEWRALHEIARGDASRAPSPDELVADLTFAVQIADAAAELQRIGARA